MKYFQYLLPVCVLKMFICNLALLKICYKAPCFCVIWICFFLADLAGIDLERLESISQNELNKLEPKEAVATSILCFHYKKQAQKEVNRHFHTLVNTVHKKIGAQTGPVERYSTCATIKVYTDHCHHGIILYQGLKSHTVEVKIICYSPNVNDVCNSLCERIQRFIKNYLSEYLDNSSTFKTFIRCELSNFGDKKNYISTKELYECLQKNKTYPCKHRTTGIHLVYPDKLLKYWTFSVEVSFFSVIE